MRRKIVSVKKIEECERYRLGSLEDNNSVGDVKGRTLAGSLHQNTQQQQ